MRVLQLIDSLAIGGAERVAVNLTNSLNEQGVETWLCATRAEGSLKEQLKHTKKYYFLKKNRTLDLAALLRIWVFIKQNDIQIIHAHSSSFFLAVLLKLTNNIKIVWHDHSGARAHTSASFNIILKVASFFFDYVLCVNNELKLWTINNLLISNNRVEVLSNFPKIETSHNIKKKKVPLTIIQVANLRHPKGHLTFLESIFILKTKYLNPIPDIQVLLVGNNYNDTYSDRLEAFVNENMLEEIRFLGARTDVAELLAQSHIGVLSSESEGFPVALMEYGMAGLATICTDVGQCREIMDNGNCGILVPPKNAEALAKGLAELITDPEKRNFLGEAFHKRVMSTYSSDAVIERLVYVYHQVYDNL